MSILCKPYFHDEEAAFAHLESVLWPNGPVCPHCGGVDRITKVKANPEKRIRVGLYRCGDCKRQFTVKVGTVFEHGRIPLHKFLQAVHLLCCSKKGVSSHQLHRILEVQYKTAWFLTHRIREAMAEGALDPFGGAGKTVEVDETYFGEAKEARPSPQRKGRPYKSRKGRGPAGKRAVIALVERGGRSRMFHVENADKATVNQIVVENVMHETHIMTDESRLYRDMASGFASHETVRHSAGEYVRYGDGDPAHTNTAEGCFSVFKRGMKGVYQHCSEKHLHRYLAEFDFRYNNQLALGIDDQQRAESALAGIVGKRLTYRDSTS